MGLGQRNKNIKNKEMKKIKFVAMVLFCTLILTSCEESPIHKNTVDCVCEYEAFISHYRGWQTRSEIIDDVEEGTCSRYVGKKPSNAWEYEDFRNFHSCYER